MANLTKVSEVEYGLFYWEYRGKYLADDEGNFLTIAGRQHDIVAMKKLADAARYYGFPEGKAVWKEGHRQLTDAEYDLMMERMENGEIPDPADPGNWEHV